ncbi:uncharacterized protein [Amphiura filiformis]|uniref:uncharacterized protein n=1 Tax=Amphiura filiformis TaxID=82378 RepID=UPI003B224543
MPKIPFDGPNSQIEYDDPVTNDPRGPFTAVSTSCASDEIEFLQGTNLIITCSSLGVNPPATITVYQGDGPGDGVADDTLLATSGAGDQTGFDTVFDYTLVAGSGTNQFDINDNGDVITCCATNSIGTTYSSACLEVLVPPADNSLTMYVGGNDGTQPTGAVAGTTHEIDEGENLIFTCWVMDANPAASITWALPGATLNDMEIYPIANNLIDTISTLVPTYHVVVEGNCNANLVCTSNHPETGYTQTDQTQLLVVVAPDDVNLQLLSTSNGPAALTGAEGTDITSNNQAVGEAQTETKLVLICGQMYDFQSSTTNGVTPEADFTWEIRSNLGTPVTPEFDDPAGDPNTVTCSPAATTSNLDDFVVQYNDDNGQFLCAIADNKHVAAGPVRECVCLDVNVEVQEAKMVMTVRHVDGTADGTVVDLAGGANLIHGEQYTVDCVVTEATPSPIIDIDLGGVIPNPVIPSPAQTDQAEGAGITREQIVTSARATFTADYATQCNGDLVCSAVNSANTLIGTGTQTVTEAAVKVSAPPTAPTISLELTDTTADQDGNNADETAILIEGMTYEFTCTVTSDPEVDVVWTLDSTANSNEVVETDVNTGVIDCTSDPYPETYQLPADRVTYANLQCGTLTCSAGGESATMTFQIWKPPTLAPGGAGVGGGDGIQLRVSTDGGTTWSAALNHLQTLDPIANTNYLFECTVFDITTVDPTPAGFPAQVCPSNINTVVRDIVDIDFSINTVDGNPVASEYVSLGVSLDAELAIGPFPGLYDLIDTLMYTVLGSDACPSTVTCAAAFDPTVPLHGVDASSPFITVRIARTIEPTIVSLVLNPIAGFNNNDQDGNNNDATAILIEGLSYNFQCTVNADPEVDVVWTVKDSTGTAIPAYSETDSNNLLDCAAVTDDYTETYEMTEVTHAALQCGSICCTAGMETEEIKFQIWKPPTIPEGGGGGGSGIRLRYRPTGGTPADWIIVPHNDNNDNENIHLVVGSSYEFECTVFNINPVSPDGSGGFNEGACTDNPTGDSSIARDIVDIDFYINTVGGADVLPPNTGVQGDNEPATANGDLFDLTDTYVHTVVAGDDCPATITCRASYDPDGTPTTAALDDSPFTTACITRITQSPSAQYVGTTGDSTVTVTCTIPETNQVIIDRYDHVEIWRDGKDVKSYCAAAADQMVTKDEGSEETWIGLFGPTKYDIVVDDVQMTITLQIMNLELTDHASYWCIFEDNVGGTDEPQVIDRVDVCITTNCADPGTPSMGSQSGTYNHGDVLTYSCNVGYTLVGANMLTCNDGTYDNVVPTCAASGSVSFSVLAEAVVDGRWLQGSNMFVQSAKRA